MQSKQVSVEQQTYVACYFAPFPSLPSLAWPDHFFSFDMGAEKNKGLAYYHYMFCAENHQILAIVDKLKIGVNSLQRRSNDTYELL